MASTSKASVSVQVSKGTPMTKAQKAFYSGKNTNRTVSIGDYEGVWEGMEDLSTLKTMVYFTPCVDDAGTLAKTPEYVAEFDLWVAALNFIADKSIDSFKKAFPDIVEAAKKHRAEQREKRKADAVAKATADSKNESQKKATSATAAKKVAV